MNPLTRCSSCGRELGEQTNLASDSSRVEGNQSGVDLLRISSAAKIDPSIAAPIGLLRDTLNHICLAVLLLVASHYMMIFILEASSGVMNLVYMVIAFPFGYDASTRRRTGLGASFVVGLSIGIMAVAAMSTVLALMLDEPFFASPRSRQDFVESSAAIMFAYAAGAATARFLEQVLPGHCNSLAGLINGIFGLTRPDQANRVADHIHSIDVLIKAVVAVALSIGALVVAIKGILH